ncbi:MAG: hypothetical protein OH324_02715 [Candidatus Parvarchaeota archaeon]|nr:hypothetical protein [Candidatus Rehaiarchaeum fermentans]
MCLYVDDCIYGIIYLSDKTTKTVDIFNFRNTDSINVIMITKIIIDQMNLNVKLKYTGSETGRIEDIPKTILDIKKALNLGWKPDLSSTQTVRESARKIIENI